MASFISLNHKSWGEIPEPTERELRDSIIHGLRSRGWERIDAENEADDRIERMRQKRKEIADVTAP